MHACRSTLEDPTPGYPFPLDLPSLIGRRTGELHAALATPTTNKAFGTTAVTRADINAWSADLKAMANDAFKRLAAVEKTPEIEALLARKRAIVALIRRLKASEPIGRKSRIHGDYHLGQVLVAQADIAIIDFEGEPRRDLAERRAKSSPLRDVAGMLRSFDYAACTALDRLKTKGVNAATAEKYALEWRDWATETLRTAYDAATGEVPSPARDDLLRLFLLQKAFYEIGYEAANRPAWLSIPVRGVLALLDEAAA